MALIICVTLSGLIAAGVDLGAHLATPNGPNLELTATAFTRSHLDSPSLLPLPSARVATVWYVINIGRRTPDLNRID